MSTIQPLPKLNKTYELRLAATSEILGKKVKAKNSTEIIDEIDDFFQEEKENSKQFDGISTKIELQDYKNAVTAFRNNDFSKAIQLFSNLLVEYPDSINCFYHRAMCYKKMNENNKAIEDLEEILGRQPENKNALLTKADIYFESGEYEFALIYYKKGYCIYPNSKEFSDGILKSKRQIFDSLKGDPLFRPNSTLFEERPSAHPDLIPPTTSTKLSKNLTSTSKVLSEDDPEFILRNSLGELYTDYEFLRKMKSQIQKIQQAKSGKIKTESGEKITQQQDEISLIVNDTLAYLDSKGKEWAEQQNSDKTSHQN